MYRVMGVDPDADQRWSGLPAQRPRLLVRRRHVPVRLPARAAPPAADPRLPRGQGRTRPGTPRPRSSPTRTGSPTPASRRWATSCRWPGSPCRTSCPPRSGSRSRSRSIRGFTRSRTDRLGNFWVDLTRGCAPHPAAARVRRRDRARSPAASSRTSTAFSTITHAGRRAADAHRRAGRVAGGDQGARHQRRRLLQRQLRAPVREPDAPGRTSSRSSCCSSSRSRCPAPSASWSATSARATRSSRRWRSSGSASRRRDHCVELQHHGTAPERRRCGDGGQGDALRRPGVGAVRRRRPR